MLFVGCSRYVEEKRDLILTLLAAHVALEWIAVAVVTHVHCVHDTVFERHVAVGAVVQPVVISNRSWFNVSRRLNLIPSIRR